MMRVDLHTHSEASPDGGLSLGDYRWAFQHGHLDVVAVTDHDTITFALQAHKALGERIIVGEEISAVEGEIIGLYITKRIRPGLSALQTVREIKKQYGLVYIPHPFETVRHGLDTKVLDEIAAFVDIVEVHNGRALLQNRSAQARAWANDHSKATASSSDAHGRAGWTKTASTIAQVPTPETLVSLLQHAEHSSRTVGLRGALYPKYNRFKKRLR